MKRLIAALLLAGTPPVLGAQSVSGRVTDAASTPVAGVEITVNGTQLATLTRDDGTYRLTQVPTGARVITARRLGYAPTQRSVTVGTADLTVDFTLSAVAMSLDAVVTTATGSQRRIELGNTIASIEVADRTATSAVTSIGDLLKAPCP